MKTGQEGVELIKKYEGCRLEAYKCPAGVWTIGYGHTAGVKAGDKITQEKADELLRADLEKFEKKVEKYDGKYHWTQNEFDALVSFAFNIGSIDQLTANGTRSRETIAEKIVQYNKAAGKVLTGLTRRRKDEKELFVSGQAAGEESGQQDRPKYSVGKTYKLAANMFVRDKPAGIIKNYLQLTTSGKSHAVRRKDNLAVLKSGTAVTCKEVQETQDSAVWIRVPSGWVCAVRADGTVYVR